MIICFKSGNVLEDISQENINDLAKIIALSNSKIAIITDDKQRIKYIINTDQIDYVRDWYWNILRC